jgi:hypothetical protein
MGKPHDSGITGAERRLVSHAYLFQFPFDILTVPEASVTSWTVPVKDREVRVYWPFRGDVSAQPAAKLMHLQNVPNLSQSILEDRKIARLEQMAISPWSQPVAYSDALRIDFRPEANPGLATEVAHHFLDLTRWWTRQWWIGRGRQHMEWDLRHGFDLDEQGQPVSGISTYSKAYGGFGIERYLDAEQFGSVCVALSKGTTIPLSWSSFLDAIYFHAIQDLRRSVLEAAIACELMIEERPTIIADAHGLSKASFVKAFAGTDLLKKLDRGLEQTIGRSFAKEQPQAFSWVKALWIARGHVAHGKAAVSAGGGKVRELTSDDQVKILDGVLHLIYWFEQIEQSGP